MNHLGYIGEVIRFCEWFTSPTENIIWTFPTTATVKLFRETTKIMSQELVPSSPSDKRPTLSVISQEIQPPTRSITSKDLASTRISPPSRSQTSPAVLEAQTQDDLENGKKFWWCPKPECGAIRARLGYIDKPRCPECNSKKIKPPENYEKMVTYQCSIAEWNYRERAMARSDDFSCLNEVPGNKLALCGGWMVPVWEDNWKGFKTKVDTMYTA